MKTNFHTFHTAPILPKATGSTTSNISSSVKGKFASALQESIQQTNSSLVLSKHAQMRLMQRGIDIPSDTWSKIENKVCEAKQMGVKDALVLTDQSALIVSAKNNVVVTAMDRHEASKQIFTNINGTILID
ncbi:MULTISPECIES: TIGR02530 family flagellar biosynthesis protein [Bacillus]|uniref:TIGR02530 family flagellar biosynthesis protein n=1 Tax=Bacillus TaxID=1386 RepID=UPI0002DF38E2|nr:MULTISPECIES: TIGR02530 family flagellar biosynthesis protein [Bacillus]